MRGQVKDMYRLTRWPLIDVSSQSVGIRKSDRLLLTSDGLMTLGDEEIARILKNNPDAPLEEVAATLIQAVEEARHPCQDNTSPARTIRGCCSTVQKPILGLELRRQRPEKRGKKIRKNLTEDEILKDFEIFRENLRHGNMVHA